MTTASTTGAGSLRAAFARFLERIRRRYFHVSLTFEGAFYCIVTLVVALAAINTSAQLLFLVFAMMCSLLILSALAAQTTLRKLEIRRVPPRVVEARRVVRVRLRLRNHKRTFPSACLRLADNLEDGTRLGAAFVLHVPARGECTETYECLFTERGVHRFGHIEIATRFPFGLIERRLGRKDPMQILVLPATIDLRQALRTARVDIGERESPSKGRGTGLYSIRQYIPGEHARDIHWKVSARSGRLMIREFENEERRRTVVALDNRLRQPDDPREREAFERAVILANSLVGLLVEDGHQVELVTASGRVPFDTGPAHLSRCRRALALLPVEPHKRNAPTLQPSSAESGMVTIAFHEGDASAGEDSVVLHIRDFREALDEVRGIPAPGPVAGECLDWGEAAG